MHSIQLTHYTNSISLSCYFMSYSCTVNAVQEIFAKFSIIDSTVHNIWYFVHKLPFHLVLWSKLKLHIDIDLNLAKQAEGTWFDTPVQFCLLNL